MAGGDRRRRLRVGLVGLLTGLSALLVALLAVATNLATSAVPERFRLWADDPRWTWGATAVLACLVVVVAVTLQQLSSASGNHSLIDERSAEPVAAGPSHNHNLPPRNPTFVGREAVFERIEAQFVAGPVAVVAMHGLGGMGKSAIAVELAHRGHSAGRYPIAWWIRAESAVTLVEDLAQLAPTLGLRISADQERTVADVLAALRNRADWLVVFDNVAEPEAVRPWLVGGAGATLITSRFRGWGAVATQIDLSQFTREESLAYLAGVTRRYESRDADELAKTLGDLPLALAQAAGYLDLHDLPISTYLALYQDRHAVGRLLAETVDGYPASVATTWLLHYEQLMRDEPAALQLLRLCAFLDPEDLDLDLLLSTSEQLPPELASAAESPVDRERVLGALIRTNLVTRIDANRVRVHRLVAQATRLHLGSDAPAWARRAVSLVNRLFPTHPDDPERWLLCASLAGHASTAIDHAESLAASNADAAALVDRLGVYLQSQVIGDVELYTSAAENGSGASGAPVRSAYSQQIRRIAPDVLAGRDRELAELADFSTSDEELGYLWLRAGPWSGKTALLAWFAHHPPKGVDIVAFFITARLAGQNDRSAFVDTVSEQLATILGEPLPSLTTATQDAHLLRMLHDAAQQSRARGRHLVLVIDGLDEDHGAHDHSVAAMLPTEPPQGLRIIVADRSNATLPADVPGRHPLRSPDVIRELSPVHRASAVRSDALRELRRLMTTDNEVLAIVSAADGPISAHDVEELTGWPSWQVQSALRTRSLVAVPGRWQSFPVFLFAHELLREVAADAVSAERLHVLRHRLRSWADKYRSDGWPDETPDYLLLWYPRTLERCKDFERLVDYVTDVMRHDRMRERSGNNQTAIAEVDAALAAVTSLGDDVLIERLSVRRAALG